MEVNKSDAVLPIRMLLITPVLRNQETKDADMLVFF
jgi:hypothetical protein